MAIDKEIKKKVTEDWLNSFTQLSACTQNKLYKLTGCLIVGVEMVNIPNIEGYKPHFVMYPLWKENAKECLNVPLLYRCIENGKGLQFGIPYLKHNALISEAIECFKKQIPISLNSNINLNLLFEFVDSLFSDILIKTNSAEQAKLFELKFYTALYTGNQAQVQNVLNQIQQASKDWNMRMFETWYGKFDLWFQIQNSRQGTN